mgnify:CR=1 FL=1
MLEYYYDPTPDDPVRSLFTIQLPVCSDHVSSPSTGGRMEVVASVVAFFLILLELILVANIAFLLYDRIPVPIERYVHLLLVFIPLMPTIMALRPSALDRVISIERVFHGTDVVILSIKNPAYAKRLLADNPESTMRVSTPF